MSKMYKEQANHTEGKPIADCLSDLNERLRAIEQWFDEAPIEELEAVEDAIEQNAPRGEITEAITLSSTLRERMGEDAGEVKDTAYETLKERLELVSNGAFVQKGADVFDLELNIDAVFSAADDPGSSDGLMDALVEYLSEKAGFCVESAAAVLCVDVRFDLEDSVDDEDLDDDETDQAMVTIETLARIREREGFCSTWSIGEVPPGRLNTPHPYRADAVLLEASWDHQKAFSVPIKGKTWMALWRAADQALQIANEEHYLFIERFEPVGDGRLRICLGS